MNVGIYESAASLNSLERWQRTVAQNISSGEQTAYKKRVEAMAADGQGELLIDPSAQVDRGEGEPAMFPVARTSISFRAGEMQTTSRSLDVALRGPGFFQVKMPDGSLAYTRNGGFHLSADRTVVTAGGAPVLTTAGTPIQLEAGKGDLAVNQDGTLSQGDTPLGKIAVVDFADASRLVPLSDGLFATAPGVSPVPVATPEVLQGNLEASNTSPLHEMVDLVTISRAYEANQKVITSRDDLMDKTLQTFG